MHELQLTPEEIKEVKNTSVYSFAFGDLVRRIESKYNLVWDIDAKVYKISDCSLRNGTITTTPTR